MARFKHIGGGRFKRRKRPRRRRRRNRVSRTVNLSPGKHLGFPDQLLIKVSYSEQGIFASGSSGSSNYFNMSLNNLWDPDPRTGGNKTSLLTNMSALYRRYNVYAAKVITELMPSGTSSITTDILMTYLGPNPATTNRAYTMHSNGAPVNNNRVIAFTSNAGAFQKSIKRVQFFDFRKLEGKEVMIDDQYFSAGSSVNNAPPKQLYWQLGVNDFTGSTGVPNIRYRVTIQYYVKFDELIEVENYAED